MKTIEKETEGERKSQREGEREPFKANPLKTKSVVGRRRGIMRAKTLIF